jgi:hypothetical protein
MVILTAAVAIARAPYGGQSLSPGIFMAPFTAVRWEANVCKIKGPRKAPLNFYNIN